MSQDIGLVTLSEKGLDAILLIISILCWIGVFIVAIVGALIGVGV